jgi:predicted RNA-binding Zn-ribbon protein involved in translation (DUF1610 family)
MRDLTPGYHPPMRRIVSCPSCKRQLDATSLPLGSRFRCRCGAVITVSATASRDAEVVRCASCGAPREAGARSCAYCGSDFTVHEQDLETICPSCLARISDSAKFCSHCGAAIAPEEIATDPTDRTCPSCGDGKRLQSRALGDTGFTALECGVCAGLWLGAEVFESLEERTRKTATAAADPIALRKEIASRPRIAPQKGVFYRPCPVCSQRMTRINFDQVSAIILDRCAPHGLWFDASELDAVLRWIKIGGERASEERKAAEERARASQLLFKVTPKTPEDARRVSSDDFDSGMSILPWLVNTIFKG